MASKQQDQSGAAAVVAIIGAALFALYLLTRKESFEIVTSRIITKGTPCSDGTRPSTLGIAPDFLALPLNGFPSKVRYWTDPVSGCQIAAQAEDWRKYPLVALTDKIQIAESLAANPELNAQALAAKITKPSGQSWQAGDSIGPCIYGTCPVGSHPETRNGQCVCILNPPLYTR
jgi:hypothetical protein